MFCETSGSRADGQISPQDLRWNGVAPAADPLRYHFWTAFPPGALELPALVRRCIVQNVKSRILTLWTALLRVVPHSFWPITTIILVSLPHRNELGLLAWISAWIRRNAGTHAT